MESAGFVEVARQDELPPGGRKQVIVDEQPILLLNIDGQLYAIDDICTHDDGPLGEGPVCGYEIECPRHGARFDVRTGAVTRMPAVEPIRVHEVRLEGDKIYVRLRED